ncbi:hypothetical protein LCGC14_2885740 [marine sediment metagenome]|uniref:Uncharacterized protein n=1 Tax=marine sediment metagenome TaxID=412755 RepID=A0A0F9A6N6_9ZZZZ
MAKCKHEKMYVDGRQDGYWVALCKKCGHRELRHNRGGLFRSIAHLVVLTVAFFLSGCSSPDAVTLTAYKGMEQGASLSGPSFSKDVGVSVGFTWYLDTDREDMEWHL